MPGKLASSTELKKVGEEVKKRLIVKLFANIGCDAHTCQRLLPIRVCMVKLVV